MTLQCRIAPCLWFDGQAEEAATFYTGIFPRSRIAATLYYGEAGRDIHGHAAGSVLTVEFELDGLHFTALNGGPQFRFSEAVSFQIECETQAEIDYYWSALTAGGSEQPCGWLKDRYGVSWQVVPSIMLKWLTGDPVRAEHVMAALMPMKKLDVAALQRAYES
ncbi:VOC family protein [Solimonas soli]|uniref:VOC family protein n=1 Tax=Solimonas soli TaxID=413479 RepID=UPI000481BC31|nr:VOC family protein [Solimonas soli]